MKNHFFTVCVLALAALSASAQPLDEFLKKARARLGTESALKNVESIRYEGDVFSPNGELFSTLTLVFDKPDRQLLRENQNGQVNQTAVNGLEGYLLSFADNDPANRILRALPPLQTKRMTSNAVENLYFFNGPRFVRGAETIDEGLVDFEGGQARKIVFQYPLGLVYVRYFDPNTAKLVATVSSDGLKMKERESIQSSNIRFPAVVDTYDEDGKLLRTVKFTEIVVNGQIPPGYFDFPE